MTRKNLFLLFVSMAILMSCLSIKPKRESVIQPIENRLPVATGYFNIANPESFDDVLDYFDGAEGSYVTDILEDKEASFAFELDVPDDKVLYENYAGTKVPYAGIVLYPTTEENNNEDYHVPNTHKNLKFILPKMQKKGERPKFNNDKEKYPLVIFSHGYSANPVYKISVLEKIASQGYVVVGLFHGDQRFSPFFNTNKNNGKNQQLTLRALSIITTINQLEKSDYFKNNIDFDNVGVGGTSFGGATITAAAGGKLLTKEGLKNTATDKRIKAVSGYVPFLGNERKNGIWGKNREGLKDVEVPFLAVAGEVDKICPLIMTEKIAKNIGSKDKYLVSMEGFGHVTVRVTDRIYTTLSTLFFDAYLKNDDASLEALKRVKKIEQAPDIEFLF